MYSALNHLSTLSSAVHHILHHLSAQRIIPPLPTPGFEIYEPPDRDMSSLQGWTADRNRELGDETKRKRKNDRDEDDESHPTQSSSWTPHQPDTPFLHRAMSGPIDRPPWTPMIPPPFHEGPYLPQPGMHQPPLPYPHPSPGMMHRPSIPDLPPLRHSPARPVNLSPATELSAYPHPPIFNSPPYPGAHGMPMPPPPPPQQAGSGSGSGSGPGSAPRDLSPLLAQNATPNSLIHSSPSNQQPHVDPPWPFGGTQQGDLNPFSGSMDSTTMSMFNNTNGVDNSGTRFEDLPTIPNLASDDEVYGSADGRETIITKKIIPAPCVKVLVE